MYTNHFLVHEVSNKIHGGTRNVYPDFIRLKCVTISIHACDAEGLGKALRVVSFRTFSPQSIDPGQQFTWEHSNLEVNKPKNRYANVIAYDHSRVILAPIEGRAELHTHTHTHIFFKKKSISMRCT